MTSAPAAPATASGAALAAPLRPCRHLGIVAGLLLCACSGGAETPSGDSAAPAQATSAAAPRCYRADRSVMGRETPLTGARSTSPGWLRVEPTTSSDSGAALIIDADGAAMDAAWTGSDSSITVVATDDFLRVSLHLTRNEEGLAGTGLATSDAELVRDSTGRLRDLRREWAFIARSAPCDSLPARARQGAP